jgi:hypothetical protein
VTAIAEKLENNYEFDFDTYRSDRTRDRDLSRLLTWIEYEEDEDVELEIAGTMYGGCAMSPNGCPRFSLEDREYTYTKKLLMTCLSLDCKDEAVTKGTISEALHEKLTEELTQSVLSANARGARNLTAACRSYIDGTDYAYEVKLNGVTYSLDTCKTALATNADLQDMLKEIWEEVSYTNTTDSTKLSVSMSPSSGLKQGDTVRLSWSSAAVGSTDGMYVVISDAAGNALASKRIDSPQTGSYTYTIPSKTDYCNNFFSDALGTCGDFTKGKNGNSFTISIATFSPKNACFGFCAPNSAKAKILQTAKTKVFSLGSAASSYTLRDVKSVTSKYVDPIANAADDEYTLYTITLKNGTKHEVRRGFAPAEVFEHAIEATGYTGDIQALLKLVKGSDNTSGTNDESTDPYSIDDVKKVVGQYTDPNRSRADDEYTLYTITLRDGSVRTAKVYFQSFSGVEKTFKDTGYTGSVWDITILAAKGSVRGASTTNMSVVLEGLMQTLVRMKADIVR